jgi:hypothetical protein
LAISKDGSIVTVVQIFQNFFTDVFKDFFVGNSGALGLIKGPVASMEGEFFFRELVLILIDFLDVERLAIHVNDQFLIGVDFVFFERSYSDDDFDAVTLAGHSFDRLYKCRLIKAIAIKGLYLYLCWPINYANLVKLIFNRFLAKQY